MNRSRPGRPTTTPAWPVSYRTFEPTAMLGPCETAGCDRAARGVCAECTGEYCLSHQQHPNHDEPVDAPE